jgi:endonuclease YncB( thermonuclease family)
MIDMKFLIFRSIPLLFLLWCQHTLAWTITGRVSAVVSGDTIKVVDDRKVQHTVRLAGIDAPEKFQVHGQRSLDSLRELVFQRGVVVDIPGNDRSSPRRGKVLVQGMHVNLEQLQRGMAWYDRAQVRDVPLADREAYAQAEAEARRQRVGLWRDAHPIPPWEYRQGRRK